MDIIRILWMYPHVVDIIHILWISLIYPHSVDIICIGHIMSYLLNNVHPIFYIYSSSVSDLCITSFTVCNSICFCYPSYFRLVCFVSEYKLDPNPIHIYVPHFITPIKTSSSFTPNFRLSCCIGVLCYNIYQYIYICMIRDEISPTLVVPFGTLMYGMAQFI